MLEVPDLLFDLKREGLKQGGIYNQSRVKSI